MSSQLWNRTDSSEAGWLVLKLSGGCESGLNVQCSTQFADLHNFKIALRKFRNYVHVFTNQFWNRNPISKLRSSISKFRYSRQSEHVQEAQEPIIIDTVLKHSAKNAISIETNKMILKDKGQKIVQPLKIDTVANHSISRWKHVRLSLPIILASA